MSDSSKVPAAGLVASFLLGLGSVILSFWMLGYFGLAFTHYLTTDPSLLGGRSWRVFVFEFTRFEPMALMIGWIAVAGLAGVAGYRMVGRAPRGNRPSLAAMAARLSLGGLAGVGLDALLLVGMLGYRAYRLLY